MTFISEKITSAAEHKHEQSVCLFYPTSMKNVLTNLQRPIFRTASGNLTRKSYAVIPT